MPENADQSSAIAIVGGGPAGLKAAEVLARRGLAVTIYERMPSPARKFLLAGRGGLNLTHSEPLPQFLRRYGPAKDWIAPTLRAYPPNALRAWSAELGEPTFVGSSRRVFPRSYKATPLLRAWLKRLEALGVKFAYRHHWRGFAPDGGLVFSTPDQSELVVKPHATLLALGGASWPRLGSDGGWVEPLTAAGVDISPLRPSNCGFIVKWSDIFRQKAEGEPIKRVALTLGNRVVKGEVLITATGIEGGAIYALSAPLRETIAREGVAVLYIDLRPDLETEELVHWLSRARHGQSQSTTLRKLAGLTPVSASLLREAGPLPTAPEALAGLIKAMPIWLVGTQPLARAISTAGGISLDEIDEAFMLRKHPGVFVAGEMLDWEAPTGGYLLQGTFATAVAAAKGIAGWIKK